MQTSFLYRLEGIRKSYSLAEHSIDALKDLSLELPAGEMVALVGPSGSGKSTLLSLLGLMETPTEGSLFFQGVDITKYHDRELTRLRREFIGFIFQNFNLLPILTAVENVEYPLYLVQEYLRSALREKALAALTAVGLEKFAHHVPSQLSGGQRQRVAIARAIVKRPKVIFADEPTANLDRKNAIQIFELLQTLKAELGTSIFIATHDRELAGMADRSLSLLDGSLVSMQPSFKEENPNVNQKLA